MIAEIHASFPERRIGPVLKRSGGYRLYPLSEGIARARKAYVALGDGARENDVRWKYGNEVVSALLAAMATPEVGPDTVLPEERLVDILADGYPCDGSDAEAAAATAPLIESDLRAARTAFAALRAGASEDDVRRTARPEIVDAVFLALGPDPVDPSRRVHDGMAAHEALAALLKGGSRFSVRHDLAEVPEAVARHYVAPLPEGDRYAALAAVQKEVRADAGVVVEDLDDGERAVVDMDDAFHARHGPDGRSSRDAVLALDAADVAPAGLLANRALTADDLHMAYGFFTYVLHDRVRAALGVEAEGETRVLVLSAQADHIVPVRFARLDGEGAKTLSVLVRAHNAVVA